MAASTRPLLASELPFLTKLRSGKVRELYEIGDDLLLVATDRVSAFDVVLAEGIPGKGRVLTELSRFWFDATRDIVANHCRSTEPSDWPELPEASRAELEGRAMRCARASPLPVEWVVRGYLTGSGWRDYRATGRVSGLRLAEGLEHAARIDPPILTPSTKAETGHDVPLDFDAVASLVGRPTAERAREAALALYARGHELALEHGFVIADTKFEFGLAGRELLLIDECLTPDSSRFWAAGDVEPGARPASYDKQVVRDYLAGLDWDKSPPPPPLPDEVVARAAQRYRLIRDRLLDDQATGAPAPA